MTIQSNFPAIKPTLNLDFANVENLDPRITFSRASTATYYGTQTAKAEENLLIQSQNFSTNWTVGNITVTVDTTAAPDGTTTADTLTATASTGAHNINQNFTVPASQRYVCSVFVKQGTYQYFQIAFGTQAGTYANFDVTTGAGVVGTSAGVVSTSIVDSGNGWYRCIVVYDATTSNGARLNMAASASATREQSWTAAGTETLFLWGAQLEQRSAVSAYTPTTTQPVNNYIPMLLTAAAGVPRFDHNPVTFESLGLEIEEQRTNLVTYSDDFDNAAWSKSNATITSNTIVAPDGTLTGDRLFEDAINSAHFTVQSFSATLGTTYTFSVFAKNDGRFLVLGFNPNARFGGTGAGAYFNLSTGVVSFTFGTVTASITPVGNGWFRCAFSATPTSTGTANASIGLSATGSASTYTGNGYSGAYIWGAQVEVGAFPTSYIPTVASQVTRSADIASMTGTNFSSWYNQAEGTVYTESAFIGLAGSKPIISIETDGNNYISIQTNPSTATTSRMNVVSGSVTQAALGFNSVFAVGVYSKNIAAYKVNDFAFSSSSAVPATDVSGTVPLVNQIRFAGLATLFSSIHIKRIAYYPLHLTDAQLQALTS